MDKKREIVLIELLILIYEVLRLVFDLSFGYVDIIFWVLLSVIVLIFNGLPRDRNYLKKDSIVFTFVSILSYILIMYLLGMFTGFFKTPYNLSFVSILKNTIPVIIVVVCQEILRHIICKKSGKNLKLVAFYTLLISFFYISLYISSYDFTDGEEIFVFTFLVLLPELARQMVYTYTCYNISFIPSLIYSIVFNTIMFYVPIYPDVGDYLNSVVGLIFPVFVYINMQKLIKSNEKKNISFRRNTIYFILVPLLLFGTVLIILISGVFTYKIVAIGSNSMNPIYYKGDAIIYKKVSAKEIEEGDIIAFRFNNYVITHRVVKIEYQNGVRYFTTKGDNNESADNVLTPESNVYGVVKYIVKYVGYPTLWFNNLLGN